MRQVPGALLIVRPSKRADLDPVGRRHVVNVSLASVPGMSRPS
jgi:hypothetical protein